MSALILSLLFWLGENVIIDDDLDEYSNEDDE